MLATHAARLRQPSMDQRSLFRRGISSLRPGNGRLPFRLSQDSSFQAVNVIDFAPSLSLYLLSSLYRAFCYILITVILISTFLSILIRSESLCPLRAKKVFYLLPTMKP